jgi:hypothetical protein
LHIWEKWSINYTHVQLGVNLHTFSVWTKIKLAWQLLLLTPIYQNLLQYCGCSCAEPYKMTGIHDFQCYSFILHSSCKWQLKGNGLFVWVFLLCLNHTRKNRWCWETSHWSDTESDYSPWNRCVSFRNKGIQLLICWHVFLSFEASASKACTVLIV